MNRADLRQNWDGWWREARQRLTAVPGALDMEWLASLDKAGKNRRIVVYCEKIWVHRDDLAKYEAETKRSVRPTLVPFGLK